MINIEFTEDEILVLAELLNDAPYEDELEEVLERIYDKVEGARLEIAIASSNDRIYKIMEEDALNDNEDINDG